MLISEFITSSWIGCFKNTSIDAKPVRTTSHHESGPKHIISRDVSHRSQSVFIVGSFIGGPLAMETQFIMIIMDEL